MTSQQESRRLIRRLQSQAEARAALAMAHCDYNDLLDFATNIATGAPLEGHCKLDGEYALSVEDLLRSLAYSTVLRELATRAEFAALEAEET